MLRNLVNSRALLAVVLAAPLALAAATIPGCGGPSTLGERHYEEYSDERLRKYYAEIEDEIVVEQKLLDQNSESGAIVRANYNTGNIEELRKRRANVILLMRRRGMELPASARE